VFGSGSRRKDAVYKAGTIETSLPTFRKTKAAFTSTPNCERTAHT
jgi:hypothetical protein